MKAGHRVYIRREEQTKQDLSYLEEEEEKEKEEDDENKTMQNIIGKTLSKDNTELQFLQKKKRVKLSESLNR